MTHRIDFTRIIIHSVEVAPYIIDTPLSHLNPDPERFIHLFCTDPRLCCAIIREMGFRDIPIPQAFSSIYVSAL